MDFLMVIINEFRGLFSDWPLGTIMAALIIITLIFVFGIIMYLVYSAYDSWFLERIEGQGKVVDKHFIPAHTTIMPIYNASTKTQTLIPVSHSDEWVVYAEISGSSSSLSVSEKFYNEVSKGTDVKVGYVKGRFSGKPYIRDLALA